MKGNLEVAAGAFKFFLSNDAQRWESMLAEALNKYAQFLINQYITFSRRETGGEAINQKLYHQKSEMCIRECICFGENWVHQLYFLII